MSQEDINPYYQSGVTGVNHRRIDAASGEHPFGSEPKEFKADLRSLIKQVADDLYDTWEAAVREYLANAETACLKVEQYVESPEESPFDEVIVGDSYEPVIEVEWDKQEQKLSIQDNGIGMAAVEVDEVFRHIGRSAARDLGAMSGAFGMGSLSFSKFIGKNNTMIMLSHSRLNDDNAAYLVTLAGVEPIRGSLDGEQYGTRFELDQKSEDMDVRSAVETYASKMRVPVLYTEYDENGNEVFNEDWGDERLYDSYESDKNMQSFSKEGLFEAYMSPDASDETLLLSMPIDRNDTSNLETPYNFDIRLLDESGKVVESSNGHTGKVPVDRAEYNQMLLNARDDHIIGSLLSKQDVTAHLTETEHDYAMSKDVLESDQPLPRGNYEYIDSLDESDIGDKVVILGPHEGRTVVSDDEWNELPEGRASQFVPEDELEDYDASTGEGDLRLPEPTTDRSSLQSNETFWKYVSSEFNDLYDNEVERLRAELEGSSDPSARMENLSVPTKENIID